jgi:hypothetical protein
MRKLLLICVAAISFGGSLQAQTARILDKVQWCTPDVERTLMKH